MAPDDKEKISWIARILKRGDSGEDFEDFEDVDLEDAFDVAGR